MIAPTPYFSDRGCHVRIYEEARALTKLGHEVCIVTYHLGRDMPGVRVVRTLRVPWYNKLEAGPSWHKPYLDLLLLWKALEEARSFQPHVIHAHLHEGTLVGSVLKYVLQIPLLFDYQGSLSGESFNHGFMSEASLKMRLFKSLERFINRQADHIITSSEQGRQELIHCWGITPTHVSTLIDGVDTDEFRQFSRSEARQKLGIAHDVKLVVFLGLFNRYQGVDLLLDAIVILKSESPDVRWLLMGFPDEEYRKKAEEMGVADIITFTGRVKYDQAPMYLSAGDVAVSPKLALTEANGKLFNYMACGLPTVVFENSINREIMDDDGVYCEHGNTKAFAEAIRLLLYDRVAMIKISQRLRERAVAVHSWSSRAKEIVSAYKKIFVQHVK